MSSAAFRRIALGILFETAKLLLIRKSESHSPALLASPFRCQEIGVAAASRLPSLAAESQHCCAIRAIVVFRSEALNKSSQRARCQMWAWHSVTSDCELQETGVTECRRHSRRSASCIHRFLLGLSELFGPLVFGTHDPCESFRSC